MISYLKKFEGDFHLPNAHFSTFGVTFVSILAFYFCEVCEGPFNFDSDASFVDDSAEFEIVCQGLTVLETGAEDRQCCATNVKRNQRQQRSHDAVRRNPEQVRVSGSGFPFY